MAHERTEYLLDRYDVDLELLEETVESCSTCKVGLETLEMLCEARENTIATSWVRGLKAHQEEHHAST